MWIIVLGGYWAFRTHRVINRKISPNALDLVLNSVNVGLVVTAVAETNLFEEEEVSWSDTWEFFDQ